MVAVKRDRCDETAMRIRDCARRALPLHPQLHGRSAVPRANNYKEKQYPVWDLLKGLNAEHKLTSVHAVLCAPRMPDEELYDLQSDTDEIKNLATSSDPQDQATLKRLRVVLNNWIKETNDQGETPENSDGNRKPKSAAKNRNNLDCCLAGLFPI